MGRGSDWFPYTVSQTKVYKDFAEISGFYNFDEVFAHFFGYFASKKLDILFYVPSISHLDG